MYQEFNQHKKSDAVKWIIAFTLIIVLISGNKLTVKAIRSESSYSNGYPRTGYRFTYKGTYTDPRAGGKPDNCIWYVLVRDKVSGEESLLHIDIQSTVTSISLSDTVYSF